MAKHYRRRNRRNPLINFFYLNPSAQYVVNIIAAIVLAGFIFSGFLLFRYSDTADLMSRGKRQIAEGRMAWAQKTFETLIAKDPGNYEAYILLGKVYLDQGNREKAEQTFRSAASLKADTSGNGAADIALSKLSILRRDFADAETRLKRALEQNPEDSEVRSAFYELYNTWGDVTLEQSKNDLEGALTRYELAYRFIQKYEQEDALKTKITDIIGRYVLTLDPAKDADKIIRALRRSLAIRFMPETLVQIAEVYEKAGQIDNAIVWYRKAFDANPNLIGVKLSGMLIKRSQELTKKGKTEEAKALMAEAEAIVKQAKVPLDSLYPIKVTDMNLDIKSDPEAMEFIPELAFQVANQAERPVPFLKVRLSLMSNNRLLSEVVKVVATPKKPLQGKGQEKSAREMVITPEQPLSYNDVHDGTISVKASIAYSEEDNPTWVVKAIREFTVKVPEQQAVTAEDQAPTLAH
jgi:tetratricopeptide (TPR) repeat protein